jgi:hypothetical protein
MTAEFFALALVAALNPKLLAIDLLLIENRRPRAMFLCLLLGGLAMLIGALVGIPGASYLTALHNLITGKSSTATQIIAVVVFVIIDFGLIIIPFVFLELRPEATKALLKHTQDWLAGHALQLMATIAVLLGAYLAVSGLVRLS